MPLLNVVVHVSEEELYQLAAYHYLRKSEGGKKKGSGMTSHYDFVDDHITERTVYALAAEAAGEAGR